MRILLSNQQYDIIEKYSQFYIRFIGGQMMPIPCDLKITDNEEKNILSGKVSIDSVINKYMEEIPWTEEEFMRRGFEDYLSYKFNINHKQAENIIIKLNKNRALKNEMYIYIMNEKAPVKSWAKIDGMTVNEYSRMLNHDLDNAYMYMITKKC